MNQGKYQPTGFKLRSAGRNAIFLFLLANICEAQARHGFYQDPKRYAYPDQAPIYWKDQADSGMTTATVSGLGSEHYGQPTSIGFARMMSMMLDAGVVDPDTPVLALSMGARPCYDAQLQARQRWPELIVGNVDEPNVTQRADVEAQYKEAHKNGLRSGTAIAGYNVEGLADVLDVWIVLASTWVPNLEELAEEHDAELWAYWAHESNGDPERCRYYFGLWTWARKVRCSLVWAYTHDHRTMVRPSGTRVAGENDHFSYAIPTAHGKPLHTSGYDGLTEGIKDCRALEAAERDGGPECQKWLKELRASVPLKVPVPGKLLPAFDLDKIRKQATEWSEKASEKPAG
jgi:hypothetical protein